MADDDAPAELIEFLIHPEVNGVFPAPYPAGRAIPDWLRNMPAETPDARTVKRCPPFLEAMTCGYIIPMPVDVTLTRTPNGLHVDAPKIDFPLIGTHGPQEYPGAPFAGMPLLKFIIPWIVQTPPGYSTLYVQPLNHFETQLMPLAGVVETDAYYRPVAIPTMVLLQPGTQATFRAGTPLVQVMPFERKAWRSGSGAWDHQKMSDVEAALQSNPHLYKEQYWKKKSYT